MKIRLQIEIMEILKGLSVRIPYNPKINEVLKALGGIYDRAGRRWILDDNEVNRQQLAELFGADATNVIARVEPKDLTPAGKQLHLGGYLVANYDERTGNVRLPDGVEIIQGHWDVATSAAKQQPCLAGIDPMLHVVVKRDFAEDRGLGIVEELAVVPVKNPLEPYADEDLHAELVNRGYRVERVY